MTKYILVEINDPMFRWADDKLASMVKGHLSGYGPSIRTADVTGMVAALAPMRKVLE